MNEDPKLILSPLSQDLSSEGKTLTVEIYRLEDEQEWVLEMLDEYGNSTVWDDKFKSELAALEEAKNAILEEGIVNFIGPADGKGDGGNWQ